MNVLGPFLLFISNQLIGYIFFFLQNNIGKKHHTLPELFCFQSMYIRVPGLLKFGRALFMGRSLDISE